MTVLDSILARTRAAGERSVALARLLVTVLLVARTFTLGAPLGGPRQLVLFGVLLLTLVTTAIIWRTLGGTSATRYSGIVSASVVLDAVTVGVALYALAVWPPPSYQGLLRSPSTAFLLLALVGSGLRFSLPLVLVSVGVNLVTLVSLLGYETFVVGRPADHEPVLSLLILFVSVSVLSIATVVRGRGLMIEGARSMIDTARVARHLGAYVSEEVAERALSGQEFALGGQRRPVVCLFSDVRGFTLYSERIEPEQLVTELNEYLEAMVTAIETEGGYIDKFIGDAIMVVFGMNDTSPDDAARAVRTARAMQRALASHNQRRSAKGLPQMAQGIGIHMGVAIVGNIGTASRVQQTVVGSVVNIASRLESATKELQVAVLMSEAVAKAAQLHGTGLPTLRALSPVGLRGLAEPLAIRTFAGDGVLPSLSGIST